LTGEDSTDLTGDIAGAAGHVTPAIAQGPISVQHHLVVPTQIAEGLVRRMRLTSVQLDHGVEIFVPNIVIAAPTGRSGRLITATGRQSVRLLDVADVPQLQRGGHTVCGCLQNIREQAPPPLPQPSSQLCGYSVGRGQTSLDGTQNDIDDLFFLVTPLNYVKYRDLQP
jgi:hypothetical protein